MLFNTSLKRKLFVPEVIQTSAMDCGPATLKSMLEGFGISASYGRLREACQTDVDGTSIDTMEEIAIQLGLNAQQTMLPADHLFLAESHSLPAIVVTRLPNGFTHFVVVWQIHGPFVQIMDPSKGRIWLKQKRFLRDMYIHVHSVPAADWYDWAKSSSFLDPLTVRMQLIGITLEQCQQFINKAVLDSSWKRIAFLDAIVRMVDAIITSGALKRGKEAVKALELLIIKEQQNHHDYLSIIPQNYWSVLPPSNRNKEEEEEEEEQILLKGVVLVSVSGRINQEELTQEYHQVKDTDRLSPDLAAVLQEPSVNPEKKLLKSVLEDGKLNLFVLIAGIALGTLTTVIEIILFRSLFEFGTYLETIWQRIGAFGVFILFLLLVTSLHIPIEAIKYRIGRRLETRLRILFLKKIPRLGDRYFHSRLTSDMTHRAHTLRQLRFYPNLAVEICHLVFEILLTTYCIIWLTPDSAPLAIFATIVMVSLSLLTQPLMGEQDLRIRTLEGAISKFYLDSLLGLIPIRTHRAEMAIRREHEGLMVDWANSVMSRYNGNLLIVTIESIVGAAFSVWIFFHFTSTYSDIKGILLLMYWTLKLPQIGKKLVAVAQVYPSQRNMLLRLLEPLMAPEESNMDIETGKEDASSTEKKKEQEMHSQAVHNRGLNLSMLNVQVQIGGKNILEDISLTIASNEHVAIVGPSGAGKSSLVGLFLGWYRNTKGSIWVESQLLTGKRLKQIRREIAWIDPEIRIWNKTILENLRYGSLDIQAANLTEVIELSDLLSMLEKFPQGLQTILGEGGGLVSGGEGQRVRLGRAMLKRNARLVIMDEPFRGLDRGKRQLLLKRAREYWKNSTLIFISHDVSETLAFDRVLVIEAGKIVEDNSPEKLLENKNSRYSMLLEADQAVRRDIWANKEWRKLWLEDGKLEEKK
ncbi:MAG: ATP-binding cassette domain-containing protein [Desulfobacterales bacterium]|nr:ATP-binding cassette domain-containing protein [Desulfobacterales bacterium]